MDNAGIAATYLRDRGLTGSFRHGLVLGSGLSAVAELVKDPITVAYRDIPGFPRSNVTGHAGQLIAGRIEGFPALVMSGRSHYYESGNIAAMRMPLELFAALGVDNLLLTSSAGSVNRDIAPGQLCIVRDHINMTGLNPLIGEPGDERFVPMNAAYGAKLRARLKRAATEASMRVSEGVYMFFPGPTFETPAEVKAAKVLGADLVGMSVVPEVVIARRFGMETAAVSVVTNYAAGLDAVFPGHEETKRMASDRALAFRRLFTHFFKGLGDVM